MTTQATLYRYVDRGVDAGLERKLREFLRTRHVRKELRKTATAKSPVIDFETILEFNMELAFRLLNSPRYFLPLADRVLEETTGIQGMHLRVRGLDKPSKARAKEIGNFIMVWGHVVDLANGGSRIRIQYLPKVWIHELDAPLNVKPWPGWGASWPLLCKVPSDLVGTVGLGDFAEATGVLTVERDEGVDPATTRGWHYVLEVNHIGVSRAQYTPRLAADSRAVCELFERLFGRTSGHGKNSDEKHKETAAVPRITIIDERGFWRGVAPDTPEVRSKLRAKGFRVTEGLASKQWIGMEGRGDRND